VSRSRRPTKPSDSPSTSGPPIRIRDAQGPRAVGAARRLIEQYGEGLGVDLGFQGFDHELARLPGEYVPPRGRLLLATVGPRAVGCVGVRPLTARTCEMKRLFVRPSAQGRGVGRALVMASLEAAREAGYRRMRLDTLGSMVPAMELYRSVGFREIRPYRFNPIPGARFFELDLTGRDRETRVSRRVTHERRRRLRRRFDLQVRREWRRYTASPNRALRGELRARFLRRYLPRRKGWVLELGPGPGRFTPTIAASGGTVVAVDLSRPMLEWARQRAKPISARLRWVRGAGERLPILAGTFGTAVVYGNILGFAGREGPRLLAELARVLRPGGRLILDVAAPVSATQEFLVVGSQRRFLRRVLRDPRRYLLEAVLTHGHQHYDPERMAFFEFDFYTVERATRELEKAGFRIIDRMAVGVVAAYQERLAASARREPRTWENLLRLEERVGRRSGVLETGDGFVVVAVRSRKPSRGRVASR